MPKDDLKECQPEASYRNS